MSRGLVSKLHIQLAISILMPFKNQKYQKHSYNHTALKAVLFYTVFASLWIYFSDIQLAFWFKDPETLTRAQMFKGLLYVAVTAPLFYLYLNYCFRQLRKRDEALKKEQKRSQFELQNRFLQMNTLFNSLNAVVYVADMENHNLLYVNKYAMEHFGSDWQGRKCFDFLQSGMKKPCPFCTNPHLLENGEPGETVIWEFLNTKNQRWYECLDKAIHWTDGRLARLEIAMDITERKELEMTKDKLLSSISHEMRTPLTAINGFTELLLGDPQIDNKQRSHVEIIYQEAEKLTELINNFLEIRNLKSDRSRINYEDVPVKTILEKAVQNARNDIKDHNVSVHCEAGTMVYGNRRELLQVVTQLVRNACQFSPNGGEINLRGTNLTNKTEIRINDQGIGIPQHDLNTIFEPFCHLDKGDNYNLGGIGLGLSIVKKIVSLHGGTIDVESIEGQGSSFILQLPRAK